MSMSSKLASQDPFEEVLRAVLERPSPQLTSVFFSEGPPAFILTNKLEKHYIKWRVLELYWLQKYALKRKSHLDAATVIKQLDAF